MTSSNLSFNDNKIKVISYSFPKNNVVLTLDDFMKRSTEKKLIPQYSHKEVKKFLKSKDFALRPIILDDEIKTSSEEDNEKLEESSRSIDFNGSFMKVQS